MRRLAPLCAILALSMLARPATAGDPGASFGPRQVLIDVRIAEVSQTALRRLGVRLPGVDGLDVRTVDPDAPLQIPDSLTNLLDEDFDSRDAVVPGRNDVRILDDRSFLRPSGQAGTLQIGGEGKLPMAGGSEEAFVGFNLLVQPTIVGRNSVRLLIQPLLQDIAFVGDLFRSEPRRVTTTVLLMDGQSVVIGGLLSDELRNEGIPGLSKIPVLGRLFRSQAYQDDRSELIVTITPQIVGGSRRVGQPSVTLGPRQTQDPTPQKSPKTPSQGPPLDYTQGGEWYGPSPIGGPPGPPR